MQGAPEGWYADPRDPAGKTLRWWNGGLLGTQHQKSGQDELPVRRLAADGTVSVRIRTPTPEEQATLDAIRRGRDRRAALVWALVAGAFCLLLLQLLLAMYIADYPCGSNVSPSPEDGSPLASYCDTLIENTSRSQELTLALFYWPAPVIAIAGGWALWNRRRRLLVGILAAGVGWTFLYAAPSVLLPSG